MKQMQQTAFEIKQHVRTGTQLDLVVPYTTPALTQTALRAAGRLGAGLDSAIRLVKVQVVPFPLDLRHSPVPVEFLEAQLEKFGVPSEIRLAREMEQGLRSTLRYKSLVVLASKKRPWRTRSERLAASLRHAGYTVVMVEENKNA